MPQVITLGVFVIFDSGVLMVYFVGDLLETQRRNFKIFRNLFYAQIFTTIVIVFLSLIEVDDGNYFLRYLTTSFLLFSIILGFAYLVYLGKLVSASGRNAALWIVSVLIFHIIGFLISFYRMWSIASELGWCDYDEKHIES